MGGIKMVKSLREDLQTQHPKLYAAFERSADIALTQWLPSVSQKNDSYNSYPHLLGIEYHINDILYRKDTPEHIIKLNPTEIYVLLCSILLHDIGKSKPDTIDHAAVSQKIIEKNWSVLGIESKRLALVIGHICRSHDCSNPAFFRQLCDVYNIDRFEPIRGRKLGALLLLADKLDNTFSRVVPPYLINEEKNVLHAVGDFRNKTQSVLVDYSAKMVRTVINKEEFEKKDISEPEKVSGALYKYLRSCHGDYVDEKVQSSALLTIVQDVYNNNLALEKIKKELYAMHIPLNAWQIECDNHLYRVKKNNDIYITDEAIEPIIDYEYCRDVLAGILYLSGTSFGRSFHTYEKLLRYVKEDTSYLYKIIYAVKRLSVLLKKDDRTNNEAKNYINIYYDNVGWQITELDVNGVYKINTWANEETAEKLLDVMDGILREKVGIENVRR
jgi:hypothetical protein